jgi:thiol-disulfide isomerase/thioredoxin
MRLTRRGLLAAGTVAALQSVRKPPWARASELGSLVAVTPPRGAPDAPFHSPDGTAHRLSDYKGEALVVNLWATWCAPCVAELPSLAALARDAGEAGIRVLPISSDRGGAPVVSDFFVDHKITGLPVLIDKDAALMHAFGVRGLPTTFVIDREGQIVGMEEGGLDWSTPEVLAQLRKLTGAGGGTHA